MAKKSGFFRKFFKIIFSLAGLALAILAIILMATPFVGQTVSGTVLGKEIAAAATLSGFAMAFGGEPVVSMTVNGESSNLVDLLPDEFGDALKIEPNTGVMIAFILLAIGALLALLYFLFSWGKKNVGLKKGLGLVAVLALVAGGVMAFFAPSFAEIETSTEEILGFTMKSGLMFGGILTGVFAIVASILMAVATLLGPKSE